ncbi:aspartyl/asparaginyl beta-hydroxylase domain-containing protein [Fulvimarina sp. 2208YS6-2-32]|uniref:Aspartyl/asparaginyl beta-hydroxylase domain-containing protein n=1 Tax=Fulvimarina uroteuthidis TaxID=3098149 RepID=A0ABU5HZR2_9HYPH|nr:aspartyl/asparaginyl beta-hydroxylase domain-containing protein [Fulvimarina sp. 2208YS6-2-32]MDY8108577.1 aspartyl/asparaginyl beta-hydroxylase domain-containing protein [Fulvimarina sp. 2208YS6-2-32]
MSKTSATQKTKTEGLEDTMSGGGFVARTVQSLVDKAERLNLKHSAVGNPPVFATDDFPWARKVEAEWQLIRAELDTLLVRKGDLPAFHEISSEVRSISSDSNWKTFFLCGYGIRSEEAIRQCPETWRILQNIPGLKSAMFSIFEPGKHLPPHRGPYNGVLRFHLGLMVPDQPDKVGIRIDDQTCHWQEGKALIFDDAYEHEAWNHSDAVRVVLFVDFEKPLNQPAKAVNKAVLNLAMFTPFIREGYKAHKKWETMFYGEGTKHR